MTTQKLLDQYVRYVGQENAKMKKKQRFIKMPSHMIKNKRIIPNFKGFLLYVKEFYSKYDGVESPKE